MIRYHAPAKVNLSLLVEPPRPDGYHPLRSLVQTVEWVDVLEVSEAEEGGDQVTVEGADLDPEDNLVTRALREVRKTEEVPPLRIHLEKAIPDRAGLGGGSSDAAAVLRAVTEVAHLNGGSADRFAPRLGADVALFLVGGTLIVSGIGEALHPQPALDGFALGLVVPRAGLSTADVYQRWDQLEGPEGKPIPRHLLPPVLRERMPIRNDLVPAAVDLHPELAELMAELRALWGVGVGMTGSGSGLFGFFPALDEAEEAVAAVELRIRAARGVTLRPRGVARVE